MRFVFLPTLPMECSSCMKSRLWKTLVLSTLRSCIYCNSRFIRYVSLCALATIVSHSIVLGAVPTKVLLLAGSIPQEQVWVCPHCDGSWRANSADLLLWPSMTTH